MKEKAKTEFKPYKKVSAHSYVFEILKNDIISGVYSAGDQLPTETELSQSLEISRASTREGLKALEGIGLITTVQGYKGGRFVKKIDSGIIKDGLDLLLQTHKVSFEELIEARKAIECLTVRMAALRRTEEDLAAMSEVLDLLSADSNEEFFRLVFDLHECVAIASGNMILYYIIQAIRKLIYDTYTQLTMAEHDIELIMKNHRAIYEAIKNCDPDRAEEAMAVDIEDYRKIFQDVVFGQSQGV